MTESATNVSLRPKELLLAPQHAASTAPRIALFHGVTGSPAELYDLAHFLHDRNFHVFVPRLSGHDAGIESLRLTTAEAWIGDADRALQLLQPLSQGPLFVGGLSFGAVLALYLASKSPREINALVLISPPLCLAPIWKEYILRALSYLPDSLINRLGTKKKTPRPEARFIRDREALDVHSIGAAARVVAIRRRALKNAHNIQTPVLLLQDPQDHHLNSSGTAMLGKALRNSTLRQCWFDAGLHELTIGPRHAEVFAAIFEFLQDIHSKQD